MSDTLWPGGPVLSQSAEVFPLGTDAVLLADFARPGRRDRILDLGTGCGVLPVLLSWENPDVAVTAVDSSPAACALARKNFEQNGLARRVTLLEADLRDYRTRLSCGAFDRTVSNPPYFSGENGFVAEGSMGYARSDLGCTLLQVCQAAAWATRWGGSFCLVYRPERIGELFSTLEQTGFTPKRLRPVHHGPGMPANLILIEARRGGRPGLRWESDLYLHTADGLESPEARRIYHR